MKPFFVYLLRCSDGSYYTGHTDDLERRVVGHQSGAVAGYTFERRPIELVWSQETATREQALAAELQIKGWSRAKKEALMAGDWDRVKSLARAKGSHSDPVRPELVEGSVQGGGTGPSTGSGRTEGRDSKRDPVRPELVEGSVQGGTSPSTGSGRTEGRDSKRDPVRPELVEGSVQGGKGPSSGAGRTEDGGQGPETIEPMALGGADSALIEAVNRGERRALAKAITLLESTRADHRLRADVLLNTLLPHTGHAIRLGVSGVPGVGKSTFIEALGLMLIGQGHRVAVLAIDPSSSVSGGSILGDKTRMEKLSVDPNAFIRPSPASGTLGGVAEKTREAMLVCEAAGYDVVIVETVGVGQSETAVASMTDMFVLMQLPNAGDDLQAIKKGVMELADLVVINKADIDPNAAARAQAHISGSLRMFGAHPAPGEWVTQVMPLSALKGQGVDAFWQHVDTFHRQRRASGEFEQRRQRQALAWMWDLVQARLQADFRQHAGVRDALPRTLSDVSAARVAPSAAARALLDLYERHSTIPATTPA